jgi:arginine utilization protein RocB
MVTDGDRKKYTSTLALFTDISRSKGKNFSGETIKECIKSLEYFEEYEKCMVLKRIMDSSKTNDSGKIK